MISRKSSLAAGLAAFACLAVPSAPAAAAAKGVLRVCSDPNNLPFSNRKEEGFENKLAELVARDLGMTVRYTWAEQWKNFVKDTLEAGKCDVVMGVPAGLDGVETTTPYYTSDYVFVYRRGTNAGLSSISDPRLRSATIGVHVVGDDSTPAMAALAREGIIDNVKGFMIYGDYGRPNPPSRLIEAVEQGKVDVAAVWGPLGGYFAKRSPVPLTVAPITGTRKFAPLVFRYSIAMGVRKGDEALKARLNSVIAQRAPDIRNLLAHYGIPVVQAKAGAPFTGGR